jgi:hypothetical protein
MSNSKQKPEPDDAFEKFKELTRKLLRVPKKEVDTKKKRKRNTKNKVIKPEHRSN